LKNYCEDIFDEESARFDYSYYFGEVRIKICGICKATMKEVIDALNWF